MRIGIPTWEDRLSPVLDAAEEMLVVETGEGSTGKLLRLSGLPAWRRARAIAGAGVEVVICGAVTGPLLDALCAAGIQVIPWVSGAVDEVLAAYTRGELDGGRFLMPGCRRARRGRGGHGHMGRGRGRRMGERRGR